MEEEKLSTAINPNELLSIDSNFVLSRLKDSETLKKIELEIAKHGFFITKPTLQITVEVTAGQTPTLDPEDLLKLFSPFGSIETISLQNPDATSALIIYKDIVSAYIAQQALNNYPIPSLNGKIVLKWLLTEQETTRKTSTPSFDENKVDSYNQSQSYAESGSKYTCRFDIQIENDKEFQVARRLIGSKGSNMKKIVDQCSKGCTYPVQDVIKLRLRGRGSGFKEGPNQQESDEPLHLCISSRFRDKYTKAKQMVQDLILTTYEDYKRFCEQAGKEVVNLNTKMSENVYGGKKKNYSKSCVFYPPEYYATPTSPPATAPQQYYYEGSRPSNSFYPRSSYTYYSSEAPQHRAYTKGYRLK